MKMFQNWTRQVYQPQLTLDRMMAKDSVGLLSSFILPPSSLLQSGTLTVFRISLRTASASSLRRMADEYFELTVRRCAKTGTTSRLMSSGMQ
jgi:hypothetical protein